MNNQVGWLCISQLFCIDDEPCSTRVWIPFEDVATIREPFPGEDVTPGTESIVCQRTATGYEKWNCIEEPEELLGRMNNLREKGTSKQ